MTAMPPAVSVLTPVYAAEAYLEECIASILRQTFTDFELILIDDASPDACPALCDKAAQSDSRVRVIHHERNMGITQARRTGVFAARGNYILFCDNDDWIEPDMLHELYAQAERTGCDMAVCDFYFGANPGDAVVCRQNPCGKDSIALMKEILVCNHPDIFHPVTWNKLVKGGIYKKVIYPNTTYSEDTVIMIQVLFHCAVFAYAGKALYHWRQRTDSTSNKVRNFDFILDDYKSYTHIARFIREHLPERLEEFTELMLRHADIFYGMYAIRERVIGVWKTALRELIHYLRTNTTECHIDGFIDAQIAAMRTKLAHLDRRQKIIPKKRRGRKFDAVKRFIKRFIPQSVITRVKGALHAAGK